MSNNKMQRKRAKNIVLGIVDVIIVLVVIYFVIGYFNFFKISKEQKPLTAGEVSSYDKNGGQVTVHNYKIYKIVKYRIPEKKISYSMKLWFMDDVR